MVTAPPKPTLDEALVIIAQDGQVVGQHDNGLWWAYWDAAPGLRMKAAYMTEDRLVAYARDILLAQRIRAGGY